MSKVSFTQFLFPDGRLRAESIEMPPEAAALAEELSAAGWSFEIECFLHTMEVHVDCCDDEGQIANEICGYGEEVVVEAVERMIRSAHKKWADQGRPKAKGGRLADLQRRMEADQE